MMVFWLHTQAYCLAAAATLVQGVGIGWVHALLLRPPATRLHHSVVHTTTTAAAAATTSNLSHTHSQSLQQVLCLVDKDQEGNVSKVDELMSVRYVPLYRPPPAAASAAATRDGAGCQ